MFNVLKTSNRKTTQMVTPTPDIQYVYNASITLNMELGQTGYQSIKSITDVSDFPFYLQMQKLYLRITCSWAIHEICLEV